MVFDLRFSPRALKDLRGLQASDQQRVLAAIERLRDNLKGDVKKLTAHTPEYRLRVGDFRVLFDVSGSEIQIYRIRHRRDAYS
jgi:mRNA interferase RelE/StbE